MAFRLLLSILATQMVIEKPHGGLLDHRLLKLIVENFTQSKGQVNARGRCNGAPFFSLGDERLVKIPKLVVTNSPACQEYLSRVRQMALGN